MEESTDKPQAGKSILVKRIFVRILLRILLFILGAIILAFFLIALACLIFPLSKGSIALPNTSSLNAGSPQFPAQFAQFTGSYVENGNQVVPIDGGPNFLPLLLTAIDNASSSIEFTTYPWGNGTFSDQVFSALIAAAKRGVAVRVLLDAEGGHEISADTIDTLEQAGGEVAKYHPFSLLNPLQYDERDHMRIFVIDQTTGFFGGMAIDDRWLGTADQKPWEDMMFQVSGAMTESLESTFAELWDQTTGKTFAESASDSIPHSSPNKAIVSGIAFVPIVSIPSQGVGQQSAGQQNVGQQSIGRQNSDPVAAAFDLSALSAQKSLFIVNPYFIPDQQFLSILEEKARAGVDVRLIVPGTDLINAIFLRAAWDRYYEELLQAGVKIYQYQPSMIHTKMMVVDGTWSLLGSANIDNRSAAINAENMMGIDDPVLASSLEQTFMNYQSQSTQVALAQWQEEYGFFPRIFSNFLLIFKKQY